ncbi:hypothetical protein ACFQMM_08970 [Saliphagus sp. GCM10025308]
MDRRERVGGSIGVDPEPGGQADSGDADECDQAGRNSPIGGKADGSSAGPAERERVGETPERPVAEVRGRWPRLVEKRRQERDVPGLEDDRPPGKQQRRPAGSDHDPGNDAEGQQGEPADDSMAAILATCPRFGTRVVGRLVRLVHLVRLVDGRHVIGHRGYLGHPRVQNGRAPAVSHRW